MFDKVLHIGINYYGTRYQLNGCINDVKNINKFLKTNYDCSKTQFKILRDDSKRSHDKPTKKNILNGFKWLTQGATKDSKLLVTYSGHGSYMTDRNSDEADRRDETICPCDGTQIVDDEIKRVLVNPLPAGCKLTAIFDCCHSGTACDLRYNHKFWLKNGKPIYQISQDGKYKNTKCQVVFISGCMDKQTSADAYINRQYQGALTASLLKSLTSLKRRKKPFTYEQVMKELYVNLKGGGYSQNPQISSGHLMNLTDIMW